MAIDFLAIDRYCAIPRQLPLVLLWAVVVIQLQLDSV